MNVDMLLVSGLLALTVVLFASERLRLDVVALLALLTLMLTGILTPVEALAGFSDPIVLIIAGLFIVGAGLFQTGVADALGQRLARFAGAGEARLVSAIMLMAPIALQAAATLQVSPYPMLMIVAIAASTAFATPIASPVNTLVLGPGDYRFSDFVRVGTPLLLLLMLAAILVTPVFFPL